MDTSELQRIAVMVALNMGLDPALCCALIANESSWDPNVTRYEPAFFTRYVEKMVGLSDEEMRGRATSYGLTQIMGQTAREQGYEGPLEGLKDPLTNCQQGFKKLQKCLSRESHEHGTYAEDVKAALLRYNGGGDSYYPERVMEHYKAYADLNSATRHA